MPVKSIDPCRSHPTSPTGRVRRRRTRAATASAAAVATVAALGWNVVAMGQAAPANGADDGQASDRPGLIGGEPRRAVTLIDGRVVEVEAPATPATSASPTTPETPASAAPAAAEGPPALIQSNAPPPPRPLRAGELHVREVTVVSANQVTRANHPTAGELAAVPVRVVRRDGRLAPATDDIDAIETTIAGLPDVGVIWDRSLPTAIEVAIESVLLERGLYATASAERSAADAVPGVAFGVLIELGPYPLDRLELQYVLDHPRHPSPARLLDTTVELGSIVGPDGVRHWLAPGPRRESHRVRLGDLGAGTLTALHDGAVRQVVTGLRDELVALGLIGVYVQPRLDAGLRILLHTGIVKEVRTLAFGERITDTDRLNHPLHRRIAERSPIRPWTPGGAAAAEADADEETPAPASRPALGSSGPVAPRPSLAATAGAGDDDPGEDAGPAEGGRPLAAAAADDAPPAAAADALGEPNEFDDPAERRDLILRPELTRYLNRLNRFPGRRVDAAFSPHADGGAVLDFLVAERRPLLLYAQASNTGTAQTDRWRYRVGFNRTQLTGNDDIFSLEYVTAGFSESHSINANYEAPVADWDLWRWRVGASWNEFTASDVGFAGEGFTGESYTVAAEISRNIAQYDDVFIDAYAGLRFQGITVDNRVVLIDGDTQLLLPSLGLRLEHAGRTRRTNAFVQLETNLAGLAGTDDDDLNRLGRLFVDDEWTSLQWGATHSFYLEPLLNRAAWEDLRTRGSSTLAHEVVLSFRGQVAFGSRLIPQAQQVVGGMFSVRGYPESVAAGDDIMVASLEYRFHLPRSVGFREDVGELFGRPFRWVPQEPYGEADWDLVAKAFVDAGRTRISDALFFEREEDLLGAGVGVELSFRRNLTLRLDWGIALEALETRGVESGDERVHFSATFLF